MSAASDYLEVEWRKHLLRTGSMTKPSALYIAVCTSAPSDSSTGSTIVEPDGSNGYARQAAGPGDSTWSAASSTNGVSTNSVAFTFGPATGSWGSCTHFAVCDGSSAGNMLFHGALTDPKTVGTGDTFVLPIDSVTVTFG